MARPASNLLGIAAMSASMLTFFINDTVVKLVSVDLPLGEIIFLRGVMAAAISWAVVVATGGLAQIRQVFGGQVVWRMIGEIGATVFYLAGFIALPVAISNAVYQVTPLASTAVAALVLKEHVGWRRWMAVTVGLVGVLIVLEPWSARFSAAALFTLASVGFVLVRDVVTARIPASVPTSLLTAVTASVVLLVGPALIPFESLFTAHTAWVMPSAWMWAQMAGGSLMLLAGYTLMVIAMRTSEMSVIAPFRYTSFLWSFIVSILVFDVYPDLRTWIGASIVIASGIYIIHRERIRRGGPLLQPTTSEVV